MLFCPSYGPYVSPTWPRCTSTASLPSGIAGSAVRAVAAWFPKQNRKAIGFRDKDPVFFAEPLGDQSSEFSIG